MSAVEMSHTRGMTISVLYFSMQTKTTHTQQIQVAAKSLVKMLNSLTHSLHMRKNDDF